MPPRVKYVGVDAMPGVVQRNRELYGEPGRVEFLLADMEKENVLQAVEAASSLWEPGDRVAVLTRHALEHNTWGTIRRFVRSLKASGAAYFIATNAVHRVENGVSVVNTERGNVLGGYFPIDFHAPPWNWRRGIATWLESVQKEDAGGTYLEVWLVSQLPDVML
jgi:hypothetical protein